MNIDIANLAWQKMFAEQMEDWLEYASDAYYNRGERYLGQQTERFAITGPKRDVALGNRGGRGGRGGNKCGMKHHFNTYDCYVDWRIARGFSVTELDIPSKRDDRCQLHFSDAVTEFNLMIDFLEIKGVKRNA